MAQNFKLVSEFQTIHRRPFELATPAILKPTNANPLLDGEFLELDDTYKMARGAGAPATVPSFAYFAERGRYETQTIQKGPFLYMGGYEADTLIMDGGGLAVGDALEVNTVVISALNKRGLVAFTAGHIIGYVTRLPGSNNNYLRFIRVG